VLVKGFDVPALVVDTHAGRVSRRLGISREKDPEKVEKDLARFFEEKEWTYVSQALVLFGRYVCLARSPKCGECALYEACPSEDRLLKK